MASPSAAQKRSRSSFLASSGPTAAIQSTSGNIDSSEDESPASLSNQTAKAKASIRITPPSSSNAVVEDQSQRKRIRSKTAPPVTIKLKHSASSSSLASSANDENVNSSNKQSNDKRQSLPASAYSLNKTVFMDFLKDLKGLKDANGRQIAYIFSQLPSKKFYPDYYAIIKSPISLAEIKEKLEKQEYKSVAGMRDDLLLMFSNAMTYNVEGSDVYNDAVFLKKYVEKKLTDDLAVPKTPLTKKSGTSQSERKAPKMPGTPAPKKRQVTKQDLKKLVKAIEHDRVDDFNNILELSDFDPNVLIDSENFNAKYQWTPLQCAVFYGRLDFMKILVERGAIVDKEDNWYGGTALAWAAFGDKIDCARYLIEQGADRMKKNKNGQTAVELISSPDNLEWLRLLTDVKARKLKPGANPLSKIKTIFDRLVRLTDDNGHLYATVFMELPSRKMYPEYYTIIRRPMAFGQIEKRLKTGYYDTFEKYEEEMMCVFQNAMFFNEAGSPIHNDAKFLKQKFEEYSDKAFEGLEIDEEPTALKVRITFQPPSAKTPKVKIKIPSAVPSSVPAKSLQQPPNMPKRLSLGGPSLSMSHAAMLQQIQQQSTAPVMPAILPIFSAPFYPCGHDNGNLFIPPPPGHSAAAQSGHQAPAAQQKPPQPVKTATGRFPPIVKRIQVCSESSEENANIDQQQSLSEWIFESTLNKRGFSFVAPPASQKLRLAMKLVRPTADGKDSMEIDGDSDLKNIRLISIIHNGRRLDLPTLSGDGSAGLGVKLEPGVNCIEIQSSALLSTDQPVSAINEGTELVSPLGTAMTQLQQEIRQITRISIIY